MNTAKTVLTVFLLGAGLGAASYVMHHKAQPIAPVVEDSADFKRIEDDSLVYWRRTALNSQIASTYRLVCSVLHNGAYADARGDCTAPVNCTSCLSHSGKARFAVIHDNKPIHGPKAAGPDYAAMMRQDKLVFQMAMADQASHVAGAQAFNHVTRCQALYAAADVQCVK